MTVNQTLKDKRKELDLTQEQVANIIFVSNKTISNWENGKTTPDLESLIRLSELFDISLDELIKGDSEMVKKIDRKIKKGEYFFFIICLLILVIGLPLAHKLFSNDVTAALLFFGYILIVFILAILLMLWGLKGLAKHFK